MLCTCAGLEGAAWRYVVRCMGTAAVCLWLVNSDVFMFFCMPAPALGSLRWYTIVLPDVLCSCRRLWLCTEVARWGGQAFAFVDFMFYPPVQHVPYSLIS